MLLCDILVWKLEVFMITNRKEAELFGAFIHISRLMELSKNVLNTNEYEKN